MQSTLIKTAWDDRAVERAVDEAISSGRTKIKVSRMKLGPYNGYPDDVMYDDIYELTASGVSAGGQVLLYKSTGEPFSEEELELAMPALVKHVKGNAAADGERVEVNVELHDDDCAILVDVWVIDDEDDDDEQELAADDVEDDDRHDGRGGGERGMQP